MKAAVALFLTFVILFMSSLTGIHCNSNFNKNEKSVGSSIVSMDSTHQTDPVDDAQGDHVCHFGHSGHCSFSYTQEVSVSLGLQIQDFHRDYVFSYLSAIIEAQKRPPIA
ncbi:MAG: hypothetical protein JSU04_20360 [Bdellovibrionales bacterium]|nr:hypothetical protein [Bdellovibrionales bacterium]